MLLKVLPARGFAHRTGGKRYGSDPGTSLATRPRAPGTQRAGAHDIPGPNAKLFDPLYMSFRED
jgi:hypothetical protein